MKIRTPTGRTLTLTHERFVAAGGEAEVYAEGAVAYKIYTDPTRAISSDKLKVLQGISHPHVLQPTHFVTDSETGETVGVAMPFVDGAQPICAFGTANSWSDNGLSASHRFDWVIQLRDMVVLGIGINLIF